MRTGERIAAAGRTARRRRPHLMLAAAVGGLALAPTGFLGVAVCALLAAAIGATTFSRRAAPFAAAIVIGAATLGAARIAAIDRPARAAPPGSAIDADATLLDTPRPTRFGSSATMRIDSGPARGLRVFARVDRGAWPPDAGPGLRVRIRALVRDARTRGAGATDPRGADANAGRPGTPGYGPLPRADNGFDFTAFLRSRGIGREVHVESMRSLGRRGGLAGVVDSIRRRAEDGIGAGLSPGRAALARGMVLGDDAELPDDVRDDFQRSGLAHLVAASGANVALLCALALPVLMAARAGPRARVAVLLSLVALYVPLAGSSASVERAGIMAAAGLVALATGRPSSAWYALLLSVAVTLGINPRATGDPGWQLSFAAVAGMLVLGPYTRRALRRLPRPLAEGIGATLAATIATAPLMAHEFGAVSLTSLPANVAALAVVAPIMWTGMAQAALAQVALLGQAPAALALGLCHAANAANGVALAWVATVARRCAEPSWAQAAIHLSWPATAAAYAALAGVLFLVTPHSPVGLPALLGDVADAWRAMPQSSRRLALALAAALVTALTAAWTLPPPPPPRRLTIDFIDVGQGDATLIRDAYGAAVLFDGGPPEARVDRTLRRLGVRRLSVVVATHQSRDHHGGLAAVIKHYPVGLFLDGGDGTRDPTFTALEREVDRRGIRRIAAHAGQTLRIGQLRIDVVWPPARAPGPPTADPNTRATTAIVSEAGFRIFLSADAESPALLPLTLPRVDAMKVPHHGSADPGLPQLLARLRPRVAGIEVGRGNDYGQPKRATLDALRNRVPYVYRTDRDGTVELTIDDGRIDVRTHR